ncbi:MAG TPA: hypothetical protein VGA99_06670 [bacterium]
MKPISRRAKRFLLVYSALLVLAAIFLIPFCGWMYQCGCTFLWAGADRYCNIHHADAPHCPWCVAGEKPLSAALLGLAIFGLPAAPIYWFNHKENASVPKLFAAGVLAFLMAAIISGYISKLWYDYPYFFFKGIGW